MSDIFIRPARIEDAQGVIDVLNPIIRAGGATAIETEYTLSAQRDFLSNIVPHAACRVAICVKFGDISGFQGYERHTALPDHVADIATFVRMNETGRNIGRRLSEATFRAAFEAGFSEMNATIRADNFAGLAFYTKIGFRDFSVMRAKPLLNGKRVDRISKRRPLSQFSPVH